MAAKPSFSDLGCKESIRRHPQARNPAAAMLAIRQHAVQRTKTPQLLAGSDHCLSRTQEVDWGTMRAQDLLASQEGQPLRASDSMTTMTQSRLLTANNRTGLLLLTPMAGGSRRSALDEGTPDGLLGASREQHHQHLVNGYARYRRSIDRIMAARLKHSSSSTTMTASPSAVSRVGGFTSLSGASLAQMGIVRADGTSFALRSPAAIAADLGRHPNAAAAARLVGHDGASPPAVAGGGTDGDVCTQRLGAGGEPPAAESSTMDDIWTDLASWNDRYLAQSQLDEVVNEAAWIDELVRRAMSAREERRKTVARAAAKTSTANSSNPEDSES